MSIEDFDRYPLLFGDSPVHPLERLTRHLGGAAVWAKREDCNSGLAFGGNKTRKLEYLVPDALAQAQPTLSRSAECSPTTPARSPLSPPGWGSRPAWCRRAG